MSASSTSAWPRRRALEVRPDGGRERAGRAAPKVESSYGSPAVSETV